MTLTQLFTAIANAIRAKTGSSSTIIASNFPTEITNIELGYEKSEGENFNLKNSANAQLAKLNINGNSVQNGTPTTSSPIAIKNAGGIINYFDKETILAKHLINSNGTITEDNYNFVSDYIEVDSNIKYTISAATNKAKRIAYYNSEQTFISRPVISNYSGTVTTPSNAKYIRLSCHNDDLDSLQLEKGNFVSSYVPYYNRMAKITETISNSDNTQSQSYTIPCQQPMRSIGNVRDEFIKQDGLWYEKHNIGVIENYNGETITTDFISTTGSLSTGAFVQYVLDDANYIECTQEQIESLESIIRAYTYEPITNINSTDEVSPYLDLVYYKKI